MVGHGIRDRIIGKRDSCISLTLSNSMVIVDFLEVTSVLMGTNLVHGLLSNEVRTLNQ